MPYAYTTGDGWAVLLPTEPDGASEAVAILDDAIRQIKAFIADETNGVGKLLGSTGQIKTLVIGTALPTPASADRYWFYSTSLNGLYFCSSGAFIPVFPTGGAALGKVLKSAGIGVLPAWGSPVPTRGTVECSTTLVPGSTDAQMFLTGSGLPTGISISGGNLRVATGYTVLIRGIASGAYNNTCAFYLKNVTAGTTLQIACGMGAVSNSTTHTGLFDVSYSNSTVGNVDISLLYTLHGSAIAVTANSTYPNARLVVEVYPN